MPVSSLFWRLRGIYQWLIEKLSFFRFEKQDGVVLLATTRNLKQIDQALQRPGRMDRILHLQRPTQMERENILKLSATQTMDENLIDFVDWKKVIKPFEQFFLCLSLRLFI